MALSAHPSNDHTAVVMVHWVSVAVEHVRQALTFRAASILMLTL